MGRSDFEIRFRRRDRKNLESGEKVDFWNFGFWILGEYCYGLRVLDFG